MKYARFAAITLLSTSLTSCSTLGSLMNSTPFRLLDQTGSALMGYLGDTESDAPKSIEERAKKMESQGLFAGGRTMGANPAAHENVASR